MITEQLRERGHDVAAVSERLELVGLKDVDLFALAAAERRAVVTEDCGDFHRQMQDATAAGMTHHGVLFTSRKQLPRGKRTIGLLVRVLDDFLARHPAEDAVLNSYRWIPDRQSADRIEAAPLP